MPKIVDRAEMQNSILDAAMKAFRDSGYHSTTMNDVAGVAGLGKGTIYLYFKSKEALATALAERHFAEAETLYMRSGQTETLEAFLTVLRKALCITDEHARSIPVFFEVLGPSFGSDAFTGSISDFFERLGQTYSAKLKLLQEKGEVRSSIDPDVMGRALAAQVDGLLLHRGLFSLGEDRYHAMVESSLELFRSGLK
ncbi:TetR/AcrR family transcriptional regulator [Pseudovibrio sp. SPO723]|uniref:TetR/AcrR family transcriptional regulator n=1 Tax=Nesiotobacter zosterae TaxID=392721 RepID=UPI0029C22F57|nr:TetR/AcrR family transcriptional regulator [Pseudovibrio sp. SPO723]MDX5594218.1 TetR/AcrR family transcriptional regulator [Pseudovibrio sp. SPO723]